MKTKLDILQVISGKIRIAHEYSDNLACYCPFHKGGKESRPSFYIYVGHPYGNKFPGMSFCHTCNRGWTLKGLLTDLGIDRRIIDQVAEGIVIGRTKTSRDYIRELTFENPILPEATLGVYDFCPNSMLDLGFPMSMLKRLDIGYDKVKRRITFPLRDHMGNLIGISGRAVDPGIIPKYYVYGPNEFGEIVSGYRLYKGRFAWNLHNFYVTALAGKLPYVVVMEGFKQVMWAIRAGFPYTVGIMGSHVTREQETLLLRLGAPILIMLDNDGPGKAAAITALKQLKRQTPYVRCVEYPTGTDGMSPDDFSVDDLTSILGGYTNGKQTAEVPREIQEPRSSPEGTESWFRCEESTAAMDDEDEGAETFSTADSPSVLPW